MAQKSSTLEQGVISCCFIVSEGEEGEEGTSEEVCMEESQSHAQCTVRWSLAASIQQPRRLRWRPLVPKRDGHVKIVDETDIVRCTGKLEPGMEVQESV